LRFPPAKEPESTINPQAKSTCRGRGERDPALGLGPIIVLQPSFQLVWSAHEGSYMFAAGRAHLGFKEKCED
jgi:hypothetical protein